METSNTHYLSIDWHLSEAIYCRVHDLKHTSDWSVSTIRMFLTSSQESESRNVYKLQVKESDFQFLCFHLIKWENDRWVFIFAVSISSAVDDFDVKISKLQSNGGFIGVVYSHQSPVGRKLMTTGAVQPLY